MSEPETAETDGELFPWADVEAARKNRSLQRKHATAEALACYGSSAKPCPKCHAPASELGWLYFRSPKWTWMESLCGRAGWMTVCDRCHVQVDYFGEVMS